ncbi:NADH-FMN oxidoreductase RutF, flavin reductase (DIM6/NTAB) family [Desulfotomaculum arcticum]|uniref:NADH-FMN oxidoreductase RutF, flavin reductase (DIM6/NTAB) family n=1 Tax=Desulfotruncus arcticus DSM 17038 TaxID=1121424 RepID=A0A1I2SZM5_9FIRM|nr:flavin reductase family protein [Desulfotruncus arcticus]SFG58103.1 NADH-FMN oxidoreductase RutF, flavin reductase (DIM6/NTAB) family [Desulfotomaculum arcticum] [Desulfotruncus arcticus DSM 17038]
MLLKPRQREQILPLPVVLISTLSADGVRNIAPWSNVTPILRPLEDVILASWIKRDTLYNIRQTREFVINIPPARMAEAVMSCSKNFAPEVDEFEQADLKPRHSSMVKAPGVEGCLAWAECKLLEEITREKYALIIGRVVHLEGNDDFFNEAGEMDYERAEPLSAMLGEKGIRFTRPVYAGRYADYKEMFISKSNNSPD